MPSLYDQRVSMADVLKEEGNKLFKSANYREAIKKYKQAISTQPSAALYTNRATCYVKLNRLRDAIEDCDKALQLDKSWIRAYIRKAETHLRLKEPEQATIALSQGLVWHPTSKEMKELLCKATGEAFEASRTTVSQTKESQHRLCSINRKIPISSCILLTMQSPQDINDHSQSFGYVFEPRLPSRGNVPRNITAEQAIRIRELQKLEEEVCEAYELQARGDIDAAIRLYEKCANSGSTSSMASLAEIYFFGAAGHPRDYKKAWHFLKRCADHGPSEFCKIAGDVDMLRSQAMGLLGEMYRMGLGVDQNLAQAEKWLKQGAEGLCPKSMMNYSNFLLQYKQGPEALEESLRWLKQSAEAGNATAMMILGMRYADGEGVEEKPDLAEEWLRKAIDAGQTTAAAVALAEFLYKTGRGSNQDVISLLEGALASSTSNTKGRDPAALCMLADIFLEEANKQQKWSDELRGDADRVALSEREEEALELLREAEISSPLIGMCICPSVYRIGTPLHSTHGHVCVCMYGLVYVNMHLCIHA